MFNELDKVIAKKTGVIGTIVDKTTKNGKPLYIVESDDDNHPGRKFYDDWWPLFSCAEEDLKIAS